MAEIYLQFEADEHADHAQIAQELAQRLKALEGVEDAHASVSEQKLGLAEAVALISGGVLILRHGRELVEELRVLIPAIVELIRDIRGIKAAFVEVGAERKLIDELTDEDLERAAE